MLIYGTTGDDIIDDTARRDQLTGYSGTDTFTLLADEKTDTILDFENGTDKIDLTAFNVTFASVEVKYLGENAFVISVNGERTKIFMEPPGFFEPDIDQFSLDETDFIFNTGAGAPIPNELLDRPGPTRLEGTDETDIFRMQLDYYRDVVAQFDPTKDKIDLSVFNTSFDELTFVERKPGKIIVKLTNENLVIRDVSHLMLAEDVTEDLFIF
jgi:hypothetical protein